MNNTNQTPNKRPAGTTQSRQQAGARPAANGARPAANSARPAANGARPAANGARPAANGARPAANGARPAANGARPTANSAKPTGARAPQPPQKKKRRFDKDRILALIMLVLVVILAAIIIICCVKAIVDNLGAGGTTGGTGGTSGATNQTTVLTDPVYTTPVAGAWNEGYVTTNRNNTAIHDGNIILVNNDHEYTFPATLKLQEMWGQEGYGSVYSLGNGMTYPNGTVKSLELSKSIVSNITTMLIDMKAANPTLTDTRRLMILSGYRTYEKQQDLYANDSESGLTAKPGHSEHHTGLTFDIRINVKGQSEIEYLNDAEQAWITANCAKYGFILRYTEDNKDITQIGGEDWHFRYVGVAHATYMVEHDLCLEEYLAFLREKHTYGANAPLEYSAEGTNYTIYYFPASVEKDNTDIYVPESGHFEISGDNVKGFIVTVTHKN